METKYKITNFLYLFCRRQKRPVPFIVTACVREVERRGMNEVGIYRVSGSASDLARLKKAFETSKELFSIKRKIFR